MADNVVITAGTGTTVHADEYTHGTLGSGKTQLVKLVDGTLDSGTGIYAGGGVEANALRVTIANDSTGVVSIDDNGSSITVDGTITETNSGSIQTAVEAIQTAVELIDNAVDGNHLNVNMNLAGTDAQAGEGAISASTLRVTIATDDDGVAHLATIAGDTTSIDGKITACNTGAVVLAASDGTDIGNVDVASVVPGTGATNLGKAEDAVHSSGDIGVMSLAVRFDAGGALAGTDGDYSPLQVDANGALRVTGGGGGTEYTEDVATANPIVGSAVMMERDDALGGLTPIEGDWASLRCDANGALWVHDDALDAALSGSELQVDVVAALPAGDNNIGNVDIVSGTVDTVTTITNDVSIDDGGNVISVDDADSSLTVDQAYHDNLQCNANMQIGDSDVGAGNPVPISDNGGAITVDGSVTATVSATDLDIRDLTSVSDSITAVCAGDATHDSAATATGRQIMAVYDSTKPTAVGDGDAVRVLADSYGRLLPGVEPTRWQAVYDSSDATGEGEVVKASAASTILVVTGFIISADIEGWVKLQDEDSTSLTGKFWFKAGGGTAWPLPSQTPIVLTSDKDLEVIAEAAGNVSVTAVGYTMPG